MNLRRNAALIASLMLDHGHRSRPISPPYSPPKREPPPMTPEQIKAQAKRARKAAKRKKTTDGPK